MNELRCETMSLPETFAYRDREVAFEPGDTVLAALIREGVHPTGGGTLCCGGDCPHCVATVDGVSYIRTCQIPATVGANVEPHPATGSPPLPTENRMRTVPITYLRAPTVLVGGGRTGSAYAASSAEDVMVFDAHNGQEVIGIYPGPQVVVRTSDGMLSVDCERIVIATGAAELQPVCPGSDLAGLYTPAAARRLVAAGIELGPTVLVGEAVSGIDGDVAEGQLLRFEGHNHVTAVVTVASDGERRYPCQSVVVGLGTTPRDTLARMSAGMDVTVIGSAASEPLLPMCPNAGLICPCSDVTRAQLDDVWDRGFTEMELLKRATLAGTGTCQGATCLPYLRSFLLERSGELHPSFTARPVARQLTMNEIAAGVHLPAYPRTALDAVHRQLGAQMDRIGGWWRPWNYGDTDSEYLAVRQRVSLGDVSTLGTLLVAGPDAEDMLQRLYPTDISTIRPGRSRYALMLNERGYVFDDGLICRELDGTFTLTFTSGGASGAEMWVRDWATSWGYDVRLLNTTFTYGAINVTGPMSRQLLGRAGLGETPTYMGHAWADVAGVRCKVFRLGFTGEQSFELHHPVADSTALWIALMEFGADLGVEPHGIEALLRLRLEKGHIIVGQDTDYDSTPRRIRHQWAVDLAKPDFIGKRAIMRTNEIELDRVLVGFLTDGAAPHEGAVIWDEGRYAGYVTSATWSPVLGTGIALGWLTDSEGRWPGTVLIDGMVARRADPPFYDPEGARARA